MMLSMKRIAARAAVVALAALAGAGLASAADLRVGANIGNVPWEFQDAPGKFVGFEIDLMNEVGKRLGKTVEIVNIPFQGLFAAVQSGQIDTAVSSITITKKRLDSVVLRAALLRQRPVADRHDGQRHQGLDGLKGKSVGVDTGSTGDIWATRTRPSTGSPRSAASRA